MIFLNRFGAGFVFIQYFLILSESVMPVSESTIGSAQEVIGCFNIFTCPENFLNCENSVPEHWFRVVIRYFSCCPKKLCLDIISSKFENAGNCGLRSKGDDLLQKGIVSVPELPWLAAIIVHNIGLAELVCTGSLINSRYVLSSAKCLIYPGMSPSFTVEMKSFKVINGTECKLATDIHLCDKYMGFFIQDVIIHPSYDSKSGLKDIALLRLDGLVPFEGYNPPVCLPASVTRLTQPGDIILVVGWNKGVLPPILKLSQQKRISAILLSNEICRNVLNVSEVIAANYMCTTKPEDVTDCDAIIGNPVVFYDSRWHFEGFVHSCNNNSGLIILTRVQNFMNWIGNNVKNESCTTPNGEVGECRYLSDCPLLLHALANPRENSDEYLSKYFCESGNELLATRGAPIVCCGISPNFTVFDSELFPPIADGSNKPIEDISIYKYCGIQNRDGYVSENENITTDEFPWVAAIYKIGDDDPFVKKEQFHYLTTGGLINRRYVLTGTRNIVVLEAKSLFVRLGEYYIDNKNDCSDVPELGLEDCSEVLDYRVEETIIHPLYFVTKGLSDLALLRLNKTVRFSDYIRPICLPKPNFDVIKPGDMLYSTGWANRKKKVATGLIGNEECKERHTAFNELIISLNKFCTQDFRNGSEFNCIADEGAPVMFASRGHQWFLIGISSNQVCNQTEPQVHTKVAGYLEWIYSKINL